MRDILEDIVDWYQDAVPFALATVVGTWSSSPRTAGASMAVSVSGEVVGSVSGGCVEGAVYDLAQQVIATGVPARETYGVSDGDAFAVGLTCGGTLEVFVELITPERFPWLLDVVAAVRERRPVAVATVIGGAEGLGRHLLVTFERVEGSAGNDSLDHSIAELARGELAHGRNAVLHVGAHGEHRMDEVTFFVESLAPSPEMIVFGAIDFAAAVVRVGKFLGYHVTVCDARSIFATPARFPEADEIVVEWPHEYLARREVDEQAVLCVLTHDPKFDVPLIIEALKTKAGYIGAMGSRRTHGERMAALRDAGVSQDALDRISSPIGLDLRGRTPEETAVSIAAEIIAARWGGSGRRLAELTTAIHA